MTLIAFELLQVLRFGLLLGVVTLVSKIAVERLGQSMLFPVAALSGLVDIDAITISTARLSGTSIEAPVATAAIVTAVAVNLLTKVVMAFVAGGEGAYAQTLGIATLMAVLAGAAALSMLGLNQMLSGP